MKTNRPSEMMVLTKTLFTEVQGVEDVFRYGFIALELKQSVRCDVCGNLPFSSLDYESISQVGVQLKNRQETFGLMKCTRAG